jgi:biopolymer transport protein ExbD
MAFGGFQQGGEAQPMAEINTTPLVDVMLVLLIIFIITAPLLTHSVRIDLPQARSEPTLQVPQVISLSIDGVGRLYWDKEIIAREQLWLRLAEAAARQPQPDLHLRADRDTRYQVLAEVMSAARTAGIQRIGFVTDPTSAIVPAR